MTSNRDFNPDVFDDLAKCVTDEDLSLYWRNQCELARHEVRECHEEIGLKADAIDKMINQMAEMEYTNQLASERLALAENTIKYCASAPLSGWTIAQAMARQYIEGRKDEN